MLISAASLDGLFKGFNTKFNEGFAGAKSVYQQIAMVAPSTASETAYGWLGQVPSLREWIGPRVLHGLEAHGFLIKNKTFEMTVEVPRTSIEDDQYGVYGPLFQEMGRSAGQHPDELVFSVLSQAFTSPCYDGQYFFDNDHPVVNASGQTVSVSNMQAGEGDPWFLLDTSRAIKPLIFQKRLAYQMQRLDQDGDPNVFFNDQYIYGVRARANAGFGLWQLAFGSKAPLNKANYAAARKAMQNLRGDNYRPLGIVPDTLLVSPNNELPALEILNSDRDAVGATNVFQNTAKLLVTPWVNP